MKKLSSWIILAILGVASCNPIVLQPSASAFRNAWLAKWLSAPTCQPPCWENIKPGATSTADALTLLYQIPNNKITYRDKSNIEWVLDGTDAGWITGDNDLVASITLDIHVGENLFLSEVNKVYGLPSQVRLLRCIEGMCEVNLTYPNHGMVVGLLLPNKGNTIDQVSISSSSLVSRIILFEDLEKYHNSPPYTGGIFLDWKGYGDYP